MVKSTGIYRHSGSRLPVRQRGAVLAVSLLLLLIMTIIGVASMQGTTLEESMAYATRDRTVALQSAEAGLRAGEAFIEAIVSPAALTGNNGLYRRTDNEPDYAAAATWTNTANHVEETDTGGSTPPDGSTSSLYFIKETGLITGVQGAMNLSGYGENKGSGDVTTFRITARGIGGTANGAEVIVRSNYGRIF